MQTSFFDRPSSPSPNDMPLAEKIRPAHLQEIHGHKRLLGPGAALRVMIEENTYTSFILWGPPGSGKTTIARLIEQTTTHHFHSLSAVFSKIADVKKLMQIAQQEKRQTNQTTLVFIDEIHRFNTSQQDAFLPYVESGAIILIGATTENPSFEIIPALLSRCHLFVLEALSTTDLVAILQRAIPHLGKRLKFAEDTLKLLAEHAGGDARRGLNDLELLCQNAEIGATITIDQLPHLLSSRPLFYDKAGEEHFNLISALQKSIRGSDPQAALYWLARLIESGEDIMYITRRLVRIASEDIGLADPQALVQAMAVKDAVHFLGMPEASTALCQLAVYLATAPKSNTLEVAWLSAREDAHNTGHLKTPLHLRNAPTRTMAALGYNKGYRYAHDFKNSYSYQKYFPDQMEEKRYYKPSGFGFEKEVQKRLDWWKKLKEEQLAEQAR